jgi:methionyl aminopeptidase
VRGAWTVGREPARSREDGLLGQVILYSERQIGLIREAGKVVSECLHIAKDLVRPGGTTRQIELAIAAHIRKNGCTSPFLGYELPGKEPFPFVVCTSVNDVVVHGFPDDRPFAEGDLVSIDCGVRKNGYIGDAAWTFAAGQPDEKGARLLQAGREGLEAGIKAARARGKIGEISRAIQTLVESRGFSVVRDYVGHGVGQMLHEEPQVPNYVKPGALLPILGDVIKPGTVIAIEPMVNEGTAQVTSRNEGEWPVHTTDGGRSVHFEHTIAIVEKGVEILTMPAPV